MAKGGGGGPELPPEGLFQGWWLPGGGPLFKLGGGGTGELISGFGVLVLPWFHGDIPPP